MTVRDLLARIARQLEETQIPYMIVGSMASSYHGEPRMTRDVDLVIDPEPASLHRFLDALSPNEFYVDRDAAATALTERSQFNVVEMASGWKVDFVIRKDRLFSLAEFKRRREADVLGVRAYVASAEDTIIAKLEWARSGDSERQLRDVAGILELSGDRLDLAYIERWTSELGLADLWSSVTRRRDQ